MALSGLLAGGLLFLRGKVSCNSPLRKETTLQCSTLIGGAAHLVGRASYTSPFLRIKMRFHNDIVAARFEMPVFDAEKKLSQMPRHRRISCGRQVHVIVEIRSDGWIPSPRLRQVDDRNLLLHGNVEE